MSGYKVNELKQYIEKSELIIVTENLHIRLSKELLEKYNQGLYDGKIKMMLDDIKEVKELGIKYPGNANPVFYIYIAPDDRFRELLSYPHNHPHKYGGRPVKSYDLDGFNSAYGMSSNLLENGNTRNIMSKVNNIHELAHLVESAFSEKDRFIAEGFAETVPLYTMNYESVFDEHREMLKTIKEEQIFSAQQLIERSENSNFNGPAIIPNKSCSFDLSYISSYLFVRGCVEKIASKFGLDKVQATQKFAEIVRQSTCSKQWLVYDIANAIGVPQEELLTGKEMQLNVIKNITKEPNMRDSLKTGAPSLGEQYDTAKSRGLNLKLGTGDIKEPDLVE